MNNHNESQFSITNIKLLLTLESPRQDKRTTFLDEGMVPNQLELQPEPMYLGPAIWKQLLQDYSE